MLSRVRRNTLAMGIPDNRRRNLRRWIDADPNAYGNVSAWCSYYSLFLDADDPLTPGHIRPLVQLDRPKPAPFGEKVARKIERAVGAAPFSLDRPPDEVRDDPASYTPSRPDVFRSSGPDVAKAFAKADPARQAVVEAALGLRDEEDLPVGAGDALRLCLKLASPDNCGSNSSEEAA